MPRWIRHWRILASAAILTALYLISKASGGRPPGVVRAGALFGIAAVYFPWPMLKFSLRTALIAITLVAVLLGLCAWVFN